MLIEPQKRLAGDKPGTLISIQKGMILTQMKKIGCGLCRKRRVQISPRESLFRHLYCAFEQPFIANAVTAAVPCNTQVV